MSAYHQLATDAECWRCELCGRRFRSSTEPYDSDCQAATDAMKLRTMAREAEVEADGYDFQAFDSWDHYTRAQEGHRTSAARRSAILSDAAARIEAGER